MSITKQKQAAENFAKKWAGRGQENKDDQKFWNEILQSVFEINDPDYIDYQKTVKIGGNTKRIDGYIADTKVLIEQKSIGIPLNRPIQHGSEKLTPFEQAKQYVNNLPHNEHPRWIVTSNFEEIWVYDLNKPGEAPETIKLADFGKDYTRLGFLVDKEDDNLAKELEISVKAGELVGVIYDELLKNYVDPESEESLKSLNILCVRLVFCLYAEDALIFGKPNRFHDYMAKFANPNDFRKALIELFKILNQKPEERDPYGDPELLSFPYVNGGLFAREDIEIPRFTTEIIDILLSQASKDFNWSDISPTIFGAVFESTLNPETRRQGGMHYTSIENIHKVIDPLFLDDLKVELEEIKKEPVDRTRIKNLKSFQDKLASLKFMDPACGSGNFCTESYLCLRRLENEVLKETLGDQIGFVFDEEKSPVKVSISQFYGIEINDFAVDVAKTALWIAESQMLEETEKIVHHDIDFLPLTNNAFIVEGNALRMEWSDVCPAEQLDYIMGNPPFVGASFCNDIQKEEVSSLLKGVKFSNSVDYVGGWYIKAAAYMQNTAIKVAFVSTNSITQGEQVAPLWKTLLFKYNANISFAWRTFIWDSEANKKAQVHCVIIGFEVGNNTADKRIFDENSIICADNINPYLVDAPNVIVESVGKPLCNVPALTKGNQPTDDGNFLLSEEEAAKLINEDPTIAHLVKRYIGGKDFLNNNEIRYCLWLKDVSPSVYKDNKEIMRRINAVREFRLKSSAEPTRKFADKPYQFFSSPQTEDDYLIIPRVSSERRRYIPIGFMTSNNIASDSCSIVMGAKMYHFGILSSNVHMAWMRTVAGRLKSDYRYSGGVVYNNFPWPQPTDEQKNRIEETAQGIISAREKFNDSSFADMYGDNFDLIYLDLKRAHQANDRAVMDAYGFSTKMTEPECVAELMKMYQKLTSR